MTKLHTLFSGSSGNSAYIQSNSTNILIDAGQTCKAITNALKELGSDIQKISAILLTHEHIDHIKALKVLTKRIDIPIYAPTKVLEFLEERDLVQPHIKLHSIDEGDFIVGDFEIKSFKTEHDALASVGYVVRGCDDRKIGLATDLGIYTDKVKKALQGCEAVVLESNYDEAMLRCSSYPYCLKRRIMSDNGHLSNVSCGEAVKDLVEKGTKHVILAHMSTENNMRDVAYETTRSIADNDVAKAGKDYTLEVARRYSLSSEIIL